MGEYMGINSDKEKEQKNNMMGKNLSIATICLLVLLASTVHANVFDVKTYGAKPNADITQALSNAWKDACAAIGSSKVVVPAGTYKLGLVSLKGPCKGPIEVQVEGTLQAPVDPGYFKGSDGWVVFERIDQFTLSGSGSFDGKDKWLGNKMIVAKPSIAKPLLLI